MNIEKAFEAFVKDMDLEMKRIPNEKGPDQLMIGVEGKHGKFLGFAVCLEEESMIMFYVSLGIQIDQEQEIAILPELMELNYKMKAGAFYIDTASHILTYRIAQYLAGDDSICEYLINRIVTYAAGVTDGYYLRIAEMIGRV